MKIAFCISGHLRTYKKDNVHKHFLNFKEYIGKFGEIDIFVACWNRQNTNNSWSAAHNLNDKNSVNYIITEDDITNHYGSRSNLIIDYDYFDSDYSPLNYQYFTTKQYSWDHRAIHNNIIHSTKMLYLIYKANELKIEYEYKNNFKYDYVFRIRPDFLFNPSEYQSAIHLDQIRNDCLYVPGSDDKFAYGSSDTMNRYSYAIFHVACAFHNNIFGDPESVQRYAVDTMFSSDKIINIPKCGLLLADNGSMR